MTITTMKKILLTLLLVSTTAVSAQLAVGKDTMSNASVSLEFDNTTNEKKGIVLPWVNQASTLTNVTPGTIIYDTFDKKVKYYKNNAWFDWSVDPTGSVNTTLQSTIAENTNAKVMIGGNPITDTTKGILVLGDTNKAMILPKVENPHLNIMNPEPGTMVYDPTNKSLAVYNGTVWSFWKD